MIRLLEIEDFKCDHPKEVHWGYLTSIRVCWVCHNYAEIELVSKRQQDKEEKETRVF